MSELVFCIELSKIFFIANSGLFIVLDTCIYMYMLIPQSCELYHWNGKRSYYSKKGNVIFMYNFNVGEFSVVL